MITADTTIAVVANPAGAAVESESLAAAMRERDIDARWFDTTPDDPGRGQAREAIAGGAELIIVCGGDGTVRACIEAAADTDTRVAIIPGGTGNLLARNLGVPLDPAAALDVATSGVNQWIDVGYANDEAFAVMAGIGLDARIMDDTDRETKDRFGSLAYVATALRHLRDGRFAATVDVDDARWSGSASSILVANHGEVQGGVKLFPDASSTDGNLDVLVTTADGFGQWLRAAWAILRDDPTAGPIGRFSGGSCTVRTEIPIVYEIDGEERPATDEIVFRVAPRAVGVVVPAEETRS